MTPPRLSLAAMLIAVTNLIPSLAVLRGSMRLCDRDFMRDATPQDIQAEINKGANVRGRDKDGFTPLHGAAGLGNAETITTLIKAGADIEAKAEDGDTLLHMAALSGRAEAITVLIEAGANGKAKDKDGRTPFDYAKHNEKLKDTDAYRLLKAAQY